MAASMMPTTVISAPLAHHERVVTSDFGRADDEVRDAC